MFKSFMVTGAVLGLAFSVQAAPGEGQGEGSGQGSGAVQGAQTPRAGRRGANPERRWERFSGRFDSNKDGKISKEEFVKGDGQMRMDANADGVVTRAEAEAQAGTGAEGVADRFFEQLDADKDGKVTTAEMAKNRETMFARMDKNADGVLTKEEFEQSRPGRGGNFRGEGAGARPGAAPVTAPAGAEPAKSEKKDPR